MRMFRKVAVLMGATLLVAACGSSGDKNEGSSADPNATPDYSGTLTILTKFGGETMSPYFEDLKAEYIKAHPNVKIELIQETDQSIKDKSKSLIASKKMPDIYFSWIGNAWGNMYIDNGLAADLTPYIGPDTDWGKTFGKASLDAYSRGGKYYGVPLYQDVKLMGANKAAFDKAGVAIPTTWEELIASCEPLRKAGYEPIAFGNKDGWPGVHWLGQLIAYNVPKDVAVADNDPKTAKFDDPGYLTALQQYSEMVNTCTDTGKDSNGVDYTTSQTALASGRAAMYYQEILEFGHYTADDSKIKDSFAIFPLPAPKDAKGDAKALAGAPEGYLVNATSKQIPLAVDFLKFITTKENAAKLVPDPFAQPSTVIGAVSADNASPALIEGVDMITKASYLAPWLDTANVPSVADAWLAGGEGLVSGSMTPEQVIESVKKASAEAAKA